MGTELEQAASAVPALARTPALDIGSEDVALPRIKIGQFMTGQVRNGLVKAGCIFASTGEDDAEVLYDPSAKNAKPLVAHVISLTKGKSITADGDLQTYAFNDPDAPADCWTTYNYVVCLPEHDAELPFKWLFTRTAAPSAKKINLVLMRNEARGPAYGQAFHIDTVPRENAKGKFFVPRVTPAEATEENIAVAAKLAEMVAGTVPERSLATSAGGADEPAI